jgi:hypothetical protein
LKLHGDRLVEFAFAVEVAGPFLALLPILFILIFGPELSYSLGSSPSSSYINLLASSTRAPPLPSYPDGSNSSY